jgi:hypothetical protein
LLYRFLHVRAISTVTTLRQSRRPARRRIPLVRPTVCLDRLFPLHLREKSCNSYARQRYLLPVPIICRRKRITATHHIASNVGEYMTRARPLVGPSSSNTGTQTTSLLPLPFMSLKSPLRTANHQRHDHRRCPSTSSSIPSTSEVLRFMASRSPVSAITSIRHSPQPSRSQPHRCRVCRFIFPRIPHDVCPQRPPISFITSTTHSRRARCSIIPYPVNSLHSCPASTGNTTRTCSCATESVTVLSLARCSTPFLQFRPPQAS